MRDFASKHYTGEKGHYVHVVKAMEWWKKPHMVAETYDGFWANPPSGGVCVVRNV